jgi:hypothetical protein
VDEAAGDGGVDQVAGQGRRTGHGPVRPVPRPRLAPVLRAVEAGGRVKTLAYLDDIYMLAPTREEAEQAYRLFEATAEEAGFNNVRPLGVGSKASEIIDSRIRPVPVLKTYLVGKDIGLMPDKIDMAVTNMTWGQTSHNTFRKASGCQALSANKIERYLVERIVGFDPVPRRVERNGRSDR